jgi:putative ABC transport system permease protein
VWNIAAKTLLSDRGKLLTALVGVVFSVVLVNVQSGLFIGLIRKASLLVDQGSADIWVGHKKMTNVDFPHDIPRAWGQRIRSVPGVKRAEPYLVGHSVMTLPDGGYEQVIVVGSDPATLLGAGRPAEGYDIRSLLQTDGILVDSCEIHKIGNPKLGDLREIGQHRARVVGFTDGLVGFIVTPYVFTTLDRAAVYLNKAPRLVSYFLIQLENGADPQEVCDRIRRRLPDVEAYTRTQYAAETVGYWMKRTGLGISFGASTVLGLIVGLVIVGQTLYASVLDRLGEFATLKAIGAREPQIYGLILCQAIALAAVGSALGLGMVACLQGAFSTPRAPINIPWQLGLGSFLLVTLICLMSSLLPYFRVRSVDPAMVLQG